MDQDDPFGNMAEAAIGLHEAFKSLVEGGFTEQQALYLVSQVLLTGAQQPPQ